MSSDAVTDRPSGLGAVKGVLERHFGTASRVQLAALAVAFIALVTAPMWGRPYLFVFTLCAIWAILAMGWDIISGHTGYISFGHSALSGASAYTMALLLNHVNPDLPMIATLVPSVVAALVVGMLFAIPSLRLRGPYFSLLTLLAVLVMFRLVFPFGQYTGGELGLRVDRLHTDPVTRYYMVLVPMLVIAIALLYVSRSNHGAVFRAIRENEPAVAAAGIDATKFKLWAFTLSAIPMGIGGWLLGHFFGNVAPSTVLIIDRSIEMIIMSAIGGMGSILGPIAGAYLFVILRDEILLHTIGLSSTQRWIVLWLVAGILLFYAGEGIFRRFWHWLGAFDGPVALLRGIVDWIGDVPRRVKARLGGGPG